MFETLLGKQVDSFWLIKILNKQFKGVVFLRTGMRVSALLIGFSLAACVTPEGQQTQPENVVVADAGTAVQSASVSNPVVTREFGGGGLNWSRMGGLRFRYIAIERNGEVFVCGAFTGRGSTNTRKLNRQAMRQARVTVDGQTIKRNLRFFTEASNSNWSTQLVGVETSCQSTGQSVDAVPLSAVRVELRDDRYRVPI